jgi:hypothetical protein
MKIKVIFLSVLVGFFFFNVVNADSAETSSGNPGRSPAVEPVMGVTLPQMPMLANSSEGFDFNKKTKVAQLSPMDHVFNLRIFGVIAFITLLPFMTFFGIKSWLENRTENSGWLNLKASNVVDLSMKRKQRDSLKKAA